MKNWLKNSPWFIATLLFSLWMYSFRVDYTSLSSWDEAWYGSIAREILLRNDWVTLHFNGVPFYDHPPMGFWIMAIFYKLFGVSEFSTRLPSVLAGIGTSVIIYKLGEGLFQKKVIGFIAALILSTCVWYVLRVRSGNLDALFLFFYVATVYTAFLTTKTFKWFPICMAVFGALIMTKTLAGVSAGMIVAWFTFPYLFKSKWNVVYVATGAVLFYIIVFPWYQYHLATNPSFYDYHFIHIGARDRSFSLQNFTQLTWELPLFYLHMGVRKWYDPWILTFGVVSVSSLIHVTLVIKQHLNKKTFDQWRLLQAELGIIGWNLVVLLPFLTTDKTEIWHLIPVYAPLALIVAYGSSTIIEWGLWIAKNVRLPFVKFLIDHKYFIPAMYVLPFIIIVFLQIKTFYREVFASSRYVVDEVDILRKAKKYNKLVFIDRDLVPIAVFYSEQPVREQSRYADDTATIQNFIDQPDEAVLVTKNSAVEQYTKSGATVNILEKNNSYSIIEEVKR